MIFTVAKIFHNVYDKWNTILEEHSHPYTKDWVLASPAVIFSCVASWLFFCLYAGPRLMKNRKPFEVKNTLLAHNVIAIILSAYVFIQGGRYGWFYRYDWKCQPIEHPDDPVVPYTTTIVWVYSLAKLLDLLDTVLFILRKKYNQVTTLHMYHHAIMPFFSWVALRFVPGGHGTLIGVLNSFVHVVMYTYYLIAGLGPEYKKYLWWKKHVTHIQLVISLFSKC
ncbi:hypothetical protein O0L34_g16473 [Tuta absoluta]|nr:hypothetical protein O0L34_g16473 [Tuta absoluta]